MRTVTSAQGAPESWPDVLRTAYLLTADHGTAEDLAAAAFARLRGRRRGPGHGREPADPRHIVLTLPSPLVRHLRTRDRRRPVPGNAFLAAYLGLPARQRALLVLRVADGLDGPAAAMFLGLPLRAARESTVDALDALRAAVPADSPHGPDGQDAAPGDLDLGELASPEHGHDEAERDPLAADPVVPRLAGFFAELCAAPPVVADPARRVDEAAARARRRRSRLAVVAAGLVLAVAGSGALLGKRHADELADQARAERRRAAEAALNPVVASSDVTTWPTRGDLAGRADLLAQVRTVAADDGTVLAVPFLGQVGGRGLALAVTSGTEDDGRPAQRLVALVGPVTRPVRSWERTRDALDPDGPDDLPVPVLSATVASGDGRVSAVVVTVSRGVSFAVSPGPRVDADGVPTRRYTGVLLRNGVGTTTWPGVPAGALMRVQYGDGPPSFGGTSLVHEQQEPPVRVRRQVLAGSCRGARFEVLRSRLHLVARDSAAQLGLGAGQVAQVQAVGCRRVADRAVAVVGVRMVDGTALQTVPQEIRYDGGVAYPGADVRAVPRGREATYPSVVALYDDDGLSSALGRNVLFCAPGGATAELVRSSVGSPGNVLAEAPLGPDGVGVGTATAPLADLLRDEQDPLFVVVRDAGGVILERLPVPTGHRLEPESPHGPVDGPGAPGAPGAFPHRR